MKMSAFEERPLVEHHDQDFYEYEQEGGWCGCFRSAFGYRWQRLRHEEEEDDNDGGGEGWMMNKLRKMKEASEVIGWPKWKTFIRNINCNRKQKNRFQYDEHSYALNFDNGCNSEEDEDLDFTLGFSSRIVVPIQHTES